jgi:hypothetical protein
MPGALARAMVLLDQRFGYKGFLPGQKESLQSILSKRSLLVVMPTGSGKSLLVASFKASADKRRRERAVWSAGELCGRHCLDFLVRCAHAEEPNLRRLAASALGKAAASIAESRSDSDVAIARRALSVLLNDPAAQVRQYARKSLAQLPPEP